MDNVSIIDAQKVLEILKEETHSGVPRINRIKENNPELFERLGKPEKLNKKVAEDLIEWSKEVYEGNKTIVENTQTELKEYFKFIDLLTNTINDLDVILTRLKPFTYKGLSKLLVSISFNSKLVTRINNFNFLCSQYQRKKITNQVRKKYYEYLLAEVFYQKAYLVIFDQNMVNFTDELFPLGMLLYDIPASDDNRIDFVKKNLF